MTKRSRDGWVMGNPPEWVAEKMLAVLERLPTHDFTWTQARDLFLEEGVPKEHADAMAHAFIRVPGVRHLPDSGVYLLPVQAASNIRHRTWRMTPRRLNIADTQVLHSLLIMPGANMTPGLEALFDQLNTALEDLYK